MKEAISSRVGALTMACVLLVSVANCSPSQYHRVRREAESSTSSLVPSSMSTPTPMSSSMMSHEGHKVNCDNVDTAILKASCPGDNMCPSDKETVEKCCHCLSTCCNATDSMESSTEGSNGKDMGTKVKDAINSAEGWLKNQGDKIKDQWGKAKDSMKETATNVKDKVQKGMESVANKFRNATRGNGTMGDNNTSESSEMSSESATSMPMTPAPGKKTKRDLHGVARPTMYESHYSGGGGDTSDASDSDEYSWSKSTRTMTGSRDSNARRYRRGMSETNKSGNNSSNTSPSSSSSPATEKSGKTKRESGSDRSSSSSSDASNSTSTDTNKKSRSQRDDRNSDSNSGGSLPPVKTATATTVTEGTISENGRSSSSSSSSSSNSRNRYRREEKGTMAKNNKDGPTPSTPESSTGNSSNAPQLFNAEETGSYEEEEKDSFHGSHFGSNHDFHEVPNKTGRSTRNGMQYSGNMNHHPTQLPIITPRGNGAGGPINMESNKDDDHDEDVDSVMEHPPIVFPEDGRGGVISSSAWASSGGNGSGRSANARSNRGRNDADNGGGRSETIRSTYYERSGSDMAPSTMMLVNTESSLLPSSPSASGMWRHESDIGYENHDQGHDKQPGMILIDESTSQYRSVPVGFSYHTTVSDEESTRANGTFMEIHMDVGTSSVVSNSTSVMTDSSNPIVFVKPGMGHLSNGAGVGCVVLRSDAVQCSYDSDCTEPMKCSFTTCEPYGHIGICADTVSR